MAVQTRVAGADTGPEPATDLGVTADAAHEVVEIGPFARPDRRAAGPGADAAGASRSEPHAPRAAHAAGAAGTETVASGADTHASGANAAGPAQAPGADPEAARASAARPDADPTRPAQAAQTAAGAPRKGAVGALPRQIAQARVLDVAEALGQGRVAEGAGTRHDRGTHVHGRGG